MADQQEGLIGLVTPTKIEPSLNGNQGSKNHEIASSDPLEAFGANIHSVVDYYRSNICSKINPNGSFINPQAEEEAVRNWSTWYDTPSLPRKTSENAGTWMQEMESMLEHLKTDPTQSLHYADRPALIEYYETKYPDQKARIQDAFASFDHDMNLVSSGIDAAFSSDESLREGRDVFRNGAVLKWPEELLEITAQEFENKNVVEKFDVSEDLRNLKTLFNLATPSSTYDVEIEIDDPKNVGINISGNRLLLKKALYNFLRNVQKRASEQHPYKNIVTIKPLQGELMIVIQDNMGGFTGEDERLIHVDENTPRIALPNGSAVPKPKIFDLGEKGSSSTGTGRGMHTAWHTIVELHKGKLLVKNISPRINETTSVGARFVAMLPLKAAF